MKIDATDKQVIVACLQIVKKRIMQGEVPDIDPMQRFHVLNRITEILRRMGVGEIEQLQKDPPKIILN
jgi:hypothetical protein